jgi:hypothetical protein
MLIFPELHVTHARVHTAVVCACQHRELRRRVCSCSLLCFTAGRSYPIRTCRHVTRHVRTLKCSCCYSHLSSSHFRHAVEIKIHGVGDCRQFPKALIRSLMKIGQHVRNRKWDTHTHTHTHIHTHTHTHTHPHTHTGYGVPIGLNISLKKGTKNRLRGL